MAENVVIATQITLIGMSLVFGSIILLWFVMAVLTRFSSEKGPAENKESQPFEENREATVESELNARRKLAAVAAVAVLYSKTKAYQEPQELKLPPTAIVSAWQAVLRSNNVRQRGPIRR